MQKQPNRFQGTTAAASPQKISLTDVWIPPYAYQQTAIDIFRGSVDNGRDDDDPDMRQVQEQVLFPLEISLRDYILRGFDVLELVLRDNNFENVIHEQPATQAMFDQPANLKGS